MYLLSISYGKGKMLKTQNNVENSADRALVERGQRQNEDKRAIRQFRSIDQIFEDDHREAFQRIKETYDYEADIFHIGDMLKRTESFEPIHRTYRVVPELRIDGKTSPCVAVDYNFTLDKGPETMVFPANIEGVISDWRELYVCYHDAVSDGTALEALGYFVIEGESA